MRIEGGYYVWTKGEVVAINDHFTTKEFTCQCHYPDCVEQRIAVEQVNRLEAVRVEHRGSVVVTSGFRCKKHQADLCHNPNIETVPDSTHTLGHASDITSNRVRELGQILPNHFKAIGTGTHCFHVDLRDDKIRRWTYSKGM